MSCDPAHLAHHPLVCRCGVAGNPLGDKPEQPKDLALVTDIKGTLAFPDPLQREVLKACLQQQPGSRPYASQLLELPLLKRTEAAAKQRREAEAASTAPWHGKQGMEAAVAAATAAIAAAQQAAAAGEGRAVAEH